MKKLYKLVLGTYLGPFIITFLITLFILVMQFLWKYIDEMVGKGLDLNIIVELLFYASANLVPLALPLAVLLSSIMTFGSMGEHYELVAFKSAGVSLQRIMSPLIAFVLVLSLGAFYFSNSIWPVANLKFASLLYDIRHKKPAIDIQDKIFYKEFDGFVIRVERNDKDNNVMHDVLIYDHRDKKGNRKVIRANKGVMSTSDDQKFIEFKLLNGHSYSEEGGKTQSHFRTNFDEEIIRFDLSTFKMERSDEERYKNNYKMLNLRQLTEQIDTLKTKYVNRFNEYQDKVGSYYHAMNDSFAMPRVEVRKEIAEASILSDLENAERSVVFEQAINRCRSRKTYVNSVVKENSSRRKYIDRHDIERHRKFTLSVACLILFFIGAPMGAIIRKGGLGMPVVVSVVFFLVFHISSITGEKLIKEGTMTVELGMWLSAMILTPIGIFLTYKASTDSSLLEMDFYSNLIKRFRAYRSKEK